MTGAVSGGAASSFGVAMLTFETDSAAAGLDSVGAGRALLDTVVGRSAFPIC